MSSNRVSSPFQSLIPLPPSSWSEWCISVIKQKQMEHSSTITSKPFTASKKVFPGSLKLVCFVPLFPGIGE